jgi:hypothetical protein
MDGSILAEMKSENVLVVAHCDDGLEHKDSRSSYYGILCSEVSMLPQDAVILLVTAYNVGKLDGLAFGIVVPGVEVLNGAL